MLEIFHVLEHITAAGQALYSDPNAASEWITQAREALLHKGWSGIDEMTSRSAAERTLSGASRSATSETEILDKLRNYLSPHADHLNYAERLQAGRIIGSGQEEGACKNLIGRRLKANTARWRTRRVNRMAGLCSLAYSDRWVPYWESA